MKRQIAIFFIISFSLLFPKNSITLINEGKNAITPSLGTSYNISQDKYYNTLGLSFLHSKGIMLYAWHILDTGNNGLYAYYIKVIGKIFLHIGTDYYESDYYEKHVNALWWGGGFSVPLDEYLDFSGETYRVTITEDDHKFWENYLTLTGKINNKLNLRFGTRIAIDQYDVYPGFYLGISYNFILNNPS